MDLRKSLFGNIVLSGGSTLTKGFGDRLLHEVQRLAVKDMRIKIFAPPERKYSTWIGGSILAGLSTFRKVYCIPYFPYHSYNRYMYTNPIAIYRCGSTSTTGTKIRKSSTQNSIRYPLLQFASERRLFIISRIIHPKPPSPKMNCLLPPHFLTPETH